MTLGFELPAPTDSLLRRFDPRWKLLSILIGVISIVVLRSLALLAIAYSGTLLLCRLAEIPWGWYWRRLCFLLPLLGGLLLFLPFVLHGEGPAWPLAGPFQISIYGLAAACRLSLKALAVPTLMLVLFAATPAPSMLKAAHALHFPGFFVQLAALTLRYLLLLLEEFGRMRIALRVRGFRNRANLHSYRMVGNVTGTLLVRSAERAERVGQAMRCRGFDGRYRAVAEFHTTWQDFFLFASIIVPSAALFVGDWLLR